MGKAQNVPNSKPPSSNNQHSSGKMALPGGTKGAAEAWRCWRRHKNHVWWRKIWKITGKSSKKTGFCWFSRENDDKPCSIGHWYWFSDWGKHLCNIAMKKTNGYPKGYLRELPQQYAEPVTHVPWRHGVGLEQIVSAYFFTWSVSRANSTQWNYECWTAPFVAVSRAELFTQHQICKGGRRIRLQHVSQQPSSWQDHPNTLEGRRQFPPDPLMSLRNQVRSMCIQAKNFTPSHVQACQHNCIAFTSKTHLQNTIWDWKLGNTARVANIPTAGAGKSQKLTPRLEWWNVAFSIRVFSESYHSPISAKKYCVSFSCRNLGVWHSFI